MDSHVALQGRRDRLRASYIVEEPSTDLHRPTSRSPLERAAFTSEIELERDALVGFGDLIALRTSLPQFLFASQSAVQSSSSTLSGEKTEGGRSKARPLADIAGNGVALLPAFPESSVNVGMRLDSNTLYDKVIMVGANRGKLRNTSLTLSSNLSMEMETGNPNKVDLDEHLTSDIAIPAKGIQDIMGISIAVPRCSVPLGPFTGYASILKSSKYLKPAQQLLHEMCGVPDSFMLHTGNVLVRSSGDVIVGADAAVDSFNGCSSGSLMPEYQQMKANLLHMQEEVCKRNRQYSQQMHMVFSSFQAVAGLDFATPFISFALKTILRNFDFMEKAILYQLRHAKKSFGGESLFPSFDPCSDRGPLKVTKTKRMNRHFDSQPVLRSQRGLPEHAVVVLKAWLFEHFLHPYPTDMDKHVLARQTGLSRNQVSNWFINARVRVWKPMVEEIHSLETRHPSESGRGTTRHEGQNTLGSDMHFRRPMTQGSKTDLQLEPEWNQVIRHRGVGRQYPSNTETECTMMDSTPTPCGGHDFRGLVSQSLALGLPQNVEFGQHRR